MTTSLGARRYSVRRAAIAALTFAVAFGGLISAGPTAAATDAPGSCSAALATSPTGAWLADAISTQGDVDWFEFDVANEGLVLITLGRLPGPYRLELWSSCGTRLKVSDRYGTIYEEIATTLQAGTYFVKVSGDGRQYYPYDDATFSSTTYRLKVRPISDGVVLLSHRGWTNPDGTVEIVGEVLNNTPELKTAITITATYYDAGGQVLDFSDAATHLDILKPQTRSPFRFDDAAPEGFDHYKLRVTSSATTATKPVSISALNRSWFTDGAGVFHFAGTIDNEHTFTITSPVIAVTLYNKLGKVFNAQASLAHGTTLAPEERTTFDVTFADHHAGHSRRVHSSQASR